MDLQEWIEEMQRFVRAKGWDEPSSPKPQTARNLAVSLAVEAAEVLELFQWSSHPPEQEALASELADVFLYLLQLSTVSEIDLERAVQEKLELNYGRSW